MPALQYFTNDLEKRMKLAQIFSQIQNIFFYFLGKKCFVQNVKKIRHFITICYNDECKMMGQDIFGQLYDVQFLN